MLRPTLALVSPPPATRGQAPLSLVLVGGIGSIGDDHHRLHQPSAALAQHEGPEGP